MAILWRTYICRPYATRPSAGGNDVKYHVRARRKVDDAHIGGVVALIDPQPASRSGDHDALPAAELSCSLQVTSLGMELHGSMGIADAKQGDPGAYGGCPIGDVQHLSTGLCRDGYGQAGPAVELLGEVNDQSGLARTGRRRDHHCGIT